MCGVTGVFYRDRGRTPDRGVLEAMTRAIAHRGPDAGAVHVGPGIGLGHRRLSIIDLAGGAQPMSDPSGRYTIVYNGEVYDDGPLRREIEGRGRRFRTSSDTETILWAYAEWGEGAVARLNGMFAFAIYDAEKHSLFLARDRLGKKPLYVYQDAERVMFASELKCFFADPSFPREIEPTAIADYFAFGYVPAPKSILRRVEKLPAGHHASFPGQVRRYWDVELGRSDGTLEQHTDRLSELLDDAVKIRLRSDVPLGAFLSGGIDSSTVVALMAKRSEVKTHTIGFSIARYDERGPAKEIAERFHTVHKAEVVEPDALRVIEELAWFYDEPFGDSSAVPTYYLSEMTRRSVTVALSGDGGDELFAGYTRYRHAREADELRAKVPRLSAMRRPLGRMFRAARFSPALRDRLAPWVRAANRPERAFYNHSPGQPLAGLKLVAAELARDYDPFEAIAVHFDRVRRADPLAQLQYVDLKTYLVDDILVKVDRASMAHGLEVRCPLLDHRVVSFAMRLPPEHKIHEGTQKVVLRRLAERYVPKGFFDRPKQGFGIPLFEWLKTDLAKTLDGLGTSGLLETKALRRAIQEHRHGLANHGTVLWNAMMFELWHRRFFG